MHPWPFIIFKTASYSQTSHFILFTITKSLCIAKFSYCHRFLTIFHACRLILTQQWQLLLTVQRRQFHLSPNQCLQYIFVHLFFCFLIYLHINCLHLSRCCSDGCMFCMWCLLHNLYLYFQKVIRSLHLLLFFSMKVCPKITKKHAYTVIEIFFMS